MTVILAIMLIAVTLVTCYLGARSMGAGLYVNAAFNAAMVFVYTKTLASIL